MEFFEMTFLMKVILCQTLLFLPYFLLRKNAAFSGRRAVLTGVLMFPFIIPFTEGIFMSDSGINKENYLVLLKEINAFGNQGGWSADQWNVSMVYGIISLGFFAFLLFRIAAIIIQIYRSQPVEGSRGRLRVSNTVQSSFSFFSFVVLSLDDAADEMIAGHEQAHCRQLHSIDKLIAELSLCYLWISPVSWIVRKEIVNVHEYLADREVLANYSAADYKQKLFDKALGVPGISQPGNAFKSKSLKNRFMMMKIKKSPFSGYRFGMVAFTAVTVFGLFAFSGGVSSESNSGSFVFSLQNDVEKQPDSYPEFPGGNDAMMKFIINNLHYPKSAMESGKEGKVMVSFIVTVDGTLKDVKTKNAVDAALDAEAVRVVSSMPKWKPAEKDNKKVNCEMILPINFKLN